MVSHMRHRFRLRNCDFVSDYADVSMLRDWHAMLRRIPEDELEDAYARNFFEYRADLWGAPKENFTKFLSEQVRYAR